LKNAPAYPVQIAAELLALTDRMDKEASLR
jgi:hypothetical protein